MEILIIQYHVHDLTSNAMPTGVRNRQHSSMRRSLASIYQTFRARDSPLSSIFSSFSLCSDLVADLTGPPLHCLPYYLVSVRYRRRVNTLTLFPPILDMLQNNSCSTLWCVLSSNAFHEVTFRIHNVEVYRVIHQVVLLARLQILRCGKVHPVLFAHLFDLLPRSCQTHDLRMEFGQVGFEYSGCISCWIHRDEKWSESVWTSLVQDVDRR